MGDAATRAAARRIRDVLTIEPTKKFDHDASPPLADRWHPGIDANEFERLVSPYFVEQDESPKCFARAALTPAKGATPKAKGIPPTSPPTEPPAGPIPPDEPGTPHTPGPVAIKTPPETIRPGGLVGIQDFRTPPGSLDAPPADEIPPDDLEGLQRAFTLDFYQDEHEPLEVGSSDRFESATFEFEQATRHHLEGALLPDTDRTLTTIEAGSIWRLLMEILASTQDETPMDMAAALCASLMLLTGRRRIECLHAMVNFARGIESTVAGAVHLTSETWTTTIQPLPELRDLPSEWFEATSAGLQLPLPPPLSLALSTWRERLTSEEISALGQSENWQRAWLDLRNRLRQSCSRFTETRCIHTLAVQTFAQTGHLRDAQMLSGSSLEHSTAAGHYYATPAHRMTSIYCDALQAMGIQVESRALPDRRLIGAPRAAIQWEKACEAVEAITARTEDSVRLNKAPLAKVVEGTHALGAYLAVLFGVCTAHRFTSSIGAMTRRDFLVSDAGMGQWSLGLVDDKSTTPELDARICVLPPLFTEQLHAYLRQLERVQRLLADRKDVDALLLERVRAALDGTGPLWFARDAEAATADTTRLDRNTLARLWPQWAIPLPLIRHLFASNAHRFDIAGSDIALQMGHSIGDSTFDACDPDSPAAFGNRIAANVQRYVEALGFRRIGVARRYDPPAALAPPPADTMIAEHKRLETMRQRRRGLKLPEPTEAEYQRGGEWVDAFAVHAAPENDSEWLIEPQSIQQLLADSQAEPLGVQQAIRAQLAALLARRRQTVSNRRTRRRPFVPQLQSPDNSYNEFSRLHFDACRWALAIEAAALAALDRGVRHDEEDSTLAATTILLASYGAGTTIPRLRHLLDPELPFHTFEQFDAGVVAEVPLGPSGSRQPNGECQILTGDCVALLSYIRRCRSKPVTQRQIEKALTEQPELRTLLPQDTGASLDDVLVLIALGRQCHIPGTRSAWERGVLDSIGPLLSRLAPLFSSRVEAPAVPPLSNTSFAAGGTLINRKKALAEYRRLRRLTHDIASGRDVANNRRRLIERAQELQDRYGSTSLISMLAAFVIYLRQNRGLADRSAYDYLTTLGTRLIRRLGAGDIHAMDPDDLEQALRHIAVESRSGGQRASASTVASAASHFSEILDRIGVEIDLSRAFDGLTFSAQRHPGYFSNQEENVAIESALSSTTHRALTTLSVDTTADTATIGEAGALIQMATGLRLSEVAGLMSRDFALDNQQLSIHVHPIKRRQLKTLSSRRVVVAPIAGGIDRQLKALLERLRSRIGNTGDLLLAPDIGTDVPAIARTISSGFRAAASTHIDGSSARGHIARHNAATAAVLATHPSRMTQTMRLLKPLAHSDGTCRRLEPLSRLPARLQFRYLAKQLGHGTPTTTLTWYAHALPLLHAQTTPWLGLTRQTEAKLLGRKVSDIDRWRGRQGGTHISHNDTFLNRFNPEWIPALMHRRVRITPEAQPSDTPDPVDLSELSGELAACVALTVREGVNEYTASGHWGITVDRYRAIVEFLGERDRGLQIGYLTGRRIRPRRHLRIPRAHDLRRIFRSIDQALEQGSLDSLALRRWLLRQLPTDSRELVFDDETIGLADAVRRHKRATTTGQQSTAAIIELPPSDRSLLLLIAAAISWARHN
ncbi:hypothetical protein ACS8YF_18260 [Salinisphaera sp. SWV1]